MQPNHSNFAIRSTRRVWTGVFALLAAMLLASGCASTRKVREIVANSNAAALQASLGVSDFGSSPPPGVDPVKAIDIFIRGHTNQPKTVAALRIRQAMLLLGQKRFNLAEAAFNEARPEHLVSARDIALKRLAGDLVWYHRNSTNSSLDSARAETALAAFFSVTSDLAASVRQGAVENEEVRDRLSEIRTHLALTLAKRAPTDELRRQRIEEAINTHASTCLSAADTAAIRSTAPWSDPAITAAIKRRAGAVTPIAEARRLSADLNPKPRFQSPDLQFLITGP